MTTIILASPSNDTLCDRTCGVCMQSIYIIDGKKMNRVYDFFKKNPDYGNDLLYNCCSYTERDYIDSLRVLHDAATEEIIEFAEQLSNNCILDDIIEKIEAYKKQNKKTRSSKTKSSKTKSSKTKSSRKN